MEATKTPDNARMQKEKIVLAMVRPELERRGISQALAAKEIGMSPSSLTQLLKGSYIADPSSHLEKIEKWLAANNEMAEKAAVMPGMSTWTSTPTSEKIIATLGYAQLAADLAIIYGAAGVGKTTTIHEYQRRYPNVWVVTMTPATSAVAQAIEEISLSVGLKPSFSAARTFRDIVRKLQGSKGLLIIDEAQHLDTKALDAIRSIHDATEVGLALLGNEVVYTSMAGGKSAAYLDRLYSRIGKKVHLSQAKLKDITEVAGIFGIKDGPSLKLLHNVGIRPGALRSVAKVLRLATMMAKGDVPQLEHIKAAWEDLDV